MIYHLVEICSTINTACIRKIIIRFEFINFPELQMHYVFHDNKIATSKRNFLFFSAAKDNFTANKWYSYKFIWFL